jgi:hypothetical protein
MRYTITIRPRIPKAELQRRAGGNVNRWVNNLIEKAIARQSVDWNEFFDQPRRRVKRSVADEIRRLDR